jgi:hypothetical protein
MLKTLEPQREHAAPPHHIDNPIAFFRALPLALAVSIVFWGALGALAYGIYELAS